MIKKRILTENADTRTWKHDNTGWAGNTLSVVKSAYYCGRGTEFSSQNPSGWLVTVPPILGDLTPLVTSMGSCMHVIHLYTLRHTHTHTCKIK